MLRYILYIVVAEEHDLNSFKFNLTQWLQIGSNIMNNGLKILS